MKKSSYFLHSTALFLSLFCQIAIVKGQYNISFSANGSSLTLDSVIVENLATGALVKLNQGDILHLGSVGMDKLTAKDGYCYISPNPLTSVGRLEFSVPESGIVNLCLLDLQGRKVLDIQQNLAKGSHQFELKGLSSGIYNLIVSGNSVYYTQKVIGISASETLPQMNYLGSTHSLPNKSNTPKATVNMIYSFGNSIRYMGFSGNMIATITNIPGSDGTITFFFNSLTCPSTVSDVDNNTYTTVVIGNQCWFKENLKTTKYRDGSTVPKIVDNTLWTSTISPAYIWYNNDSATYKNVYGALYNGYAALNDNICPLGWHVPSSYEFTVLTNGLGGENIAGGKLKEIGTNHWLTPNFNGSNSSGFTALPAGHRINGPFDNLNYSGYFWTVSNSGNIVGNYYWYRGVYHSTETVGHYDQALYMGYSIRCLKD